MVLIQCINLLEYVTKYTMGIRLHRLANVFPLVLSMYTYEYMYHTHVYLLLSTTQTCYTEYCVTTVVFAN